MSGVDNQIPLELNSVINGGRMRFRSARGVSISMIAAAMSLAVSVALPIRAHHAHPAGVFNDAFSDVQGVVKEVRLRPPHVWVMLEVRGDAGETQLWPLEGASPSVLEKIGVTSSYLKAGDTVKARCRRLRVVAKGGDNDCILGFLKGPDGTVKDWSGNNTSAPADF